MTWETFRYTYAAGFLLSFGFHVGAEYRDRLRQDVLKRGSWLDIICPAVLLGALWWLVAGVLVCNVIQERREYRRAKAMKVRRDGPHGPTAPHLRSQGS